VNQTTPYPATGIALLLVCGRQVLVGRRGKSPMPGSWQLPGGWLHYRESVDQALLRLLSRFSGVQYESIEFVTYTNNLFPDTGHSVSLYFRIDGIERSELDWRANNDCSDWRWADWYDLPQPLFLPLQRLLDSGYSPIGKN
jgi:8-oxo-dGTP diphosphatase